MYVYICTISEFICPWLAAIQALSLELSSNEWVLLGFQPPFLLDHIVQAECTVNLGMFTKVNTCERFTSSGVFTWKLIVYIHAFCTLAFSNPWHRNLIFIWIFIYYTFMTLSLFICTEDVQGALANNIENQKCGKVEESSICSNYWKRSSQGIEDM